MTKPDPADRPTLEELAAMARSPRGIQCPHCGAAAEWSVSYTRDIPGGKRRVRTCRACGHKVVTVEKIGGGTPPKPA